MRGTHQSPVDSPHKGQRQGALLFSLICAWTNGWANNRDAGDLRRRRVHHDVTLMICSRKGNGQLQKQKSPKYWKNLRQTLGRICLATIMYIQYFSVAEVKGGKCALHVVYVYAFYVFFMIQHSNKSLYVDTRASIHWADGRLTARSREVSKPRESGLYFFNRSAQPRCLSNFRAILWL